MSIEKINCGLLSIFQNEYKHMRRIRKGIQGAFLKPDDYDFWIDICIHNRGCVLILSHKIGLGGHILQVFKGIMVECFVQKSMGVLFQRSKECEVNYKAVQKLIYLHK